ncbi:MULTISPECIES: hypothetical protein [Vibrio]|uniref:hypothetical protein n=1 Tax=Vibrio TaxID=662 RepID=UPI000977B053|nr:hypothetical protein [Vibrio splendidus]OMO28173.1 hypothetical protein BH581_11180 [Vibrio splendidus]PMI25563.1 hypothetical protein BCU48_23395 [Vibrio splendidus]
MTKRRNTVNGHGNIFHAEISPETGIKLNFIIDLVEESGGSITKNKLLKRIIDKEVSDDCNE